jgi:hypothetical protein
MRANYGRRRETGYAEGLADDDDPMKLPTFPDTRRLYIAEGCKRRRQPGVANMALRQSTCTTRCGGQGLRPGRIA